MCGQEAVCPLPSTRWFDYARYDFVVDGRRCIVVAPHTVAPGVPWIWRARFFGERPEVDLALLAQGFHLAFMDVAGLCGSPKAVAHWNAFHRFLTEEHGFSSKAALEGISRGGLILYNWAAANPDRVACIYADIPVCDFKSWPAGFGRGQRNGDEWHRCLEAYGMNEEEARAYSGNPIDNLEPLARAGVPILHAHGDADPIVPLAENTAVVAERYARLGGEIEVIIKKEVGHRSGLDDVTPVVEFIRGNAGPKPWWRSLLESPARVAHRL